MKIKLFCIMMLAAFSFVNNLFLYNDNLEQLVANGTQEAYLQMINPNIEIETEEKQDGYLQMVYKNFIYFIFFYNSDDVSSIIEVSNYY